MEIRSRQLPTEEKGVKRKKWWRCKKDKKMVLFWAAVISGDNCGRSRVQFLIKLLIAFYIIFMISGLIWYALNVACRTLGNVDQIPTSEEKEEGRTPLSRPFKRKQAAEAPSAVDQALIKYMEKETDSKDCYHYFGLSVASQLRGLSKIAASFAMTKIQHVLLEVESSASRPTPQMSNANNDVKQWFLIAHFLLFLRLQFLFIKSVFEVQMDYANVCNYLWHH